MFALLRVRPRLTTKIGGGNFRFSSSSSSSSSSDGASVINTSTSSQSSNPSSSARVIDTSKLKEAAKARPPSLFSPTSNFTVVKSGVTHKNAATPNSAGSTTTKTTAKTTATTFVKSGPRAVGKVGLMASAGASATMGTSMSKSGGGFGGVSNGRDDNDNEDDDVYAALERRYAEQAREDDDGEDGDEDCDDSTLTDEERALRLMSPNPVDHVFVEGTPLERKKRERDLAYARYHNLKQFVEESLAIYGSFEKSKRERRNQLPVWTKAPNELGVLTRDHVRHKRDSAEFMSNLENLDDPDAFFAINRKRMEYIPITQVPLDHIHPLNLPLLKKFFDEYGMMKSRYRTGLSGRVQRKVNRAVRRARHMGLITFKRGCFAVHSPFADLVIGQHASGEVATVDARIYQREMARASRREMRRAAKLKTDLNDDNNDASVVDDDDDDDDGSSSRIAFNARNAAQYELRDGEEDDEDIDEFDDDDELDQYDEDDMYAQDDDMLDDDMLDPTGSNYNQDDGDLEDFAAPRKTSKQKTNVIAEEGDIKVALPEERDMFNVTDNKKKKKK